MRAGGIPNNSTYYRKLVSLPFPGAADPDFVVNDEDISAAAVGDTFTILNARIPLTGRNITLTLTDASGTSLTMSVEVLGYDQFGNPIAETISATASAAGTGAKIFVSITSVTVTAVANAAASDLANVGIGDKMGLPFKVGSNETATVTRTASGSAPVTFVDSSTYIDRTYSAIQAVGSGGSGALAATDCISVFAELDVTGPDDRFQQAA